MNWPWVSRARAAQQIEKLAGHNKSLRGAIGTLRSELVSLRQDKQKLEQQVIDLHVGLEAAKIANAKPAIIANHKQRPEPANWVQSRDRLEQLSHTQKITDFKPEENKQEAS